MLRGPDPDLFRTKVYGARWYCDPLPACELAPATEEKWPAITTIKKAWSKPFRKTLPTGERVPLDAFWAAEFTVDHLAAVNALTDDRAAAVTLVATSATRYLNSTANRGTGIHTVMEDLGAGKEINEVWLDPAVVPFLPACRQFIADWHPVWVATEFVALNRTIGFGGTGDAIVTIQRDGAPWTAIVDYKSRGGDHGCYEEDAAQIGGYSLAEYIVVTSPDTGAPTRIPMPAIDGGLLISLTKDSYQLFPVDLDDAREAFRAMRESWHHHREGQKAARRARKNILIATGTTGNPAERQTLSEPPAQALSRGNGDQPAAESDGGDTASESESAAGPTLDIWQPPLDDPQMHCAMCDAEPGNPHLPNCCPHLTRASAERLAWLRGRIEAIKAAGWIDELALTWPQGVPTLRQGGLTDAHVDAIARACSDVERTHGLTFHDGDPLFAAFGQNPAVALEEAVTAARTPQPTAQEWATRCRAVLDPLGDDAIKKAVIVCAAGSPEQKATRVLHDRIVAVVGELLFTQDDGLHGAVIAECGDDGTWSIVPSPTAVQRMVAAHGGDANAAVESARVHAKALGLPHPRTLPAAAKRPLLAALVAAGHHQ